MKSTQPSCPSIVLRIFVQRGKRSSTSHTSPKSNYLIDHKVAVPEKKRQFVMTSGENIVWLVGRRVDDRYKITPHTENVLKITREII